MQRDNAYLLDILDAARIVVHYVSDKTREEFLEDMQCQDAVIRRFILIGEAARRISLEIQSRYPHLPWKEMIDMRNLVVHKYEDIDLHIVWDTAHQDLPELIRSLEEIEGTDDPEATG
jgi:uncharacterized protein with HEPN domain